MEYFADLDTHKFRGLCVKSMKKDITFKKEFTFGRKFSEDTATVYKWYWDAKTVIDSNGILYYYYQNQESCVRSL